MRTPNIKGLLAVKFNAKESAEILLWKLRGQGFVGGEVAEDTEGKYSINGLEWNPILSDVIRKREQA